MKIAVCLGAKDEVELIGAAVAHLRRIGVDHIIACDVSSRDGTRQILDRLAAEPWLEVMPVDDLDPKAEEGLDQRVMDHARAAGADWLLFLDADEFALPVGGSLKAILARTAADALEIARYNVPLGPRGPLMAPPEGEVSPETVHLFVPQEDRAVIRSRIRADQLKPWIQGIPDPKIMVRLSAVEGVAEGGHGVTGSDGRRRPAEVAAGIVIAHLPFTTAPRFARKVENMRRVIGAVGHLWGPNSAWHWRRWLDNIDAHGGVEGELARNRLSEAEIVALRSSGLIRTAAEIIGAR